MLKSSLKKKNLQGRRWILSSKCFVYERLEEAYESDARAFKLICSYFDGALLRVAPFVFFYRKDG
jgi:hypothetical protein